MKLTKLLTGLTLSAAAIFSTPASAQIEIQWWHALTGANNDVVVRLAEEFNKSQSEYKVVPTYKGGYADTMNAGIAAFRAGNAPHIMQVFEVGTATMMAAKGAIKPVHDDAGSRREVRSAGLSADHHRLLLDAEGRDALVPLQLVLRGDVVQQGRLQESGP
jgi:ABC-type glycerol-3-phosphate transport system substrate-binding protein